MTKRKKVNTLDLIQQMTQKYKKTFNEVEHIRQERSPKTGITDPKQHIEPKSVRKEATKVIPRERKSHNNDNRAKSDEVILKKLNLLLDAESFRDKKEIFTWSLSGDCLSKYDRLATGISYKLGIGTSRNQLMRKVLEDFIHRKYNTLIKEIELK